MTNLKQPSSLKVVDSIVTNATGKIIGARRVEPNELFNIGKAKMSKDTFIESYHEAIEEVTTDEKPFHAQAIEAVGTTEPYKERKPIVFITLHAYQNPEEETYNKINAYKIKPEDIKRITQYNGYSEILLETLHAINVKESANKIEQMIMLQSYGIEI